MARRLYVHLNSTAIPEHTIVVYLQPGQTAADLHRVFVESYQRNHPRYSKFADSAALEDGRKSKLAAGQALDSFPDRADLFFVVDEQAAAVSVTEENGEEAKDDIKLKKVVSGKKEEAVGTLTEGRQNALVLKIKYAQEMQSKGHLKKARDVFIQLLGMVEADTLNSAVATVRQICHQQLGMIHYFNNRFDKAADAFSKAVKLADKFGKADSSLLGMLGKSQFGTEDFEEARETLDRALMRMKKSDTADRRDLQVWKARALYAMRAGNGEARSEGIAILEQLIKEDENETNALAYYSQIAIDMGQERQAIAHVLRALVGCSGNNKNNAAVDKATKTLVQKQITNILSKAGGIEAVLGELKGAGRSTSILTFLAQTVKDQGAIDCAIELYRIATKADDLDYKEKANVWLNLIHTVELKLDYQEAFGLIKTYLDNNQKDGVEKGYLTAGQFYDVIKGIEDIYDPNLRLGTAKNVPAWTKVPTIFDAGFTQVKIPDTEDDEKAKKEGADDAVNPLAKRDKPLNPYPNEELNLLAMLFTCVKILYIAGALQPIPSLIALIEPLRIGRELHLTSTRNEHAYYSCISQLLSQIPFPVWNGGVAEEEKKAKYVAGVTPPVPAKGLPSVYVCGDSHCMSSAWQSVTLQERKVLLVPRLVTGLKCWHLRNECNFYPKRNFEHCVDTIPSKATVVFVFGEIDCREGILIAVEKGRYEEPQEGVNAAVQVYVSKLEQVAKQKRLTAYVHPIVPVLDPTRKMVKMFTATLKAAVLKSVSLKWLDFFEQLLLEDQNGFNHIYSLDGTHMSPRYVPLLEAAINKHLA